MRSIWPSGMFSMAVVPRVAEPTRTPSTSTSACALFDPRRKIDVALPMPPEVAVSTPPYCWRTCASDSWPLASMSRAVTTTTERRESERRCSIRPAVTTVSLPW